MVVCTLAVCDQQRTNRLNVLIDLWPLSNTATTQLLRFYAVAISRKVCNQVFFCVNAIREPILLNSTSNSIPDDRNETVWSVVLAQDHLLRAQEGDTYFVKLFEQNTTKIYCDMNGSAAQVETVRFPKNSYFFSTSSRLNKAFLDHRNIVLAANFIFTKGETVFETSKF